MRFVFWHRGQAGARLGLRLPAFVCFVAATLALGGCAASRTPGPRAPIPTNDPLPGANRALPSEENQVPALARPAFPDYPADLSSTGVAPLPGTRTDESDRGGTGSGETPLSPRPVPSTTQTTSPSGTVPPPPVRPPMTQPSETFYSVQLQVASTADRAKEWQARAATIFRVPVRVDAEEGLHKLRVGRYAGSDSAEEMRREAVAAGYVDALVVEVGQPRGEAGR